MSQQHPLKWRHFEADIVLLCMRWYVRYPPSSCERGLSVDHTTIYRWVE
jgi:transposase, IS6 family